MKLLYISMQPISVYELGTTSCRIHRLGQTVDVDIYRLICIDSVEERLLSLQVKPLASIVWIEIASASMSEVSMQLTAQEVKRKLSQQVMGSAERATGQQHMKLSFDELRSFFND